MDDVMTGRVSGCIFFLSTASLFIGDLTLALTWSPDGEGLSDSRPAHTGRRCPSPLAGRTDTPGSPASPCSPEHSKEYSTISYQLGCTVLYFTERKRIKIWRENFFLCKLNFLSNFFYAVTIPKLGTRRKAAYLTGYPAFSITGTGYPSCHIRCILTQNKYKFLILKR